MPTNRLKALLAGAIILLVIVVAGLGIAFVMVRQPPKTAPNAVALEVSDTACTPNAVSVAAGSPDFSIHNTSDRAIEWEILDGVMVVAERENIAPGFTVQVTPSLKPGSYAMTCGLLSNPHGTLTVVATGAATAGGPPKLADLVAPTAEYRVYAIRSADDLTMATAALATAVKAGDLATARSHAADALAAFAHLAPIAHLFDRDAGPLASGPTALPELARSLGATPPPDGTVGVADTAARAAASLGGTVHTTTAAPHEIVAGAGTVVAGLAGGFTDTADAGARIAGVRKVVDLFRPLTLRADKALSAKLDGDLGTVEASLSKLGATPPDTGTSTVLKGQLADLGADFTDLLAALGLNAT